MKIDKTGGDYVFASAASYSQERLWFLDWFDTNTAVYNIPYMATVKGAVHRKAFNAAVNRLIARQESLRTCFVETGGKPKQVVHPRLSVEVDFEDLTGLDLDAAAERRQQICTEVTSTPFDLRAAPLFRITLVATRSETTIITTLHHIISDGWSVGVFQRELAALYQEELGGRPAALPELRIQYVDYAAWQRGRLEGDSLARLKDYWLAQLAGAPTVLEIPGDHPRPSKQTFRGDVHLFDLDAALTARVQALAKRQDSTLFMTLFSAFAALLWRLTGQTDMLVGTPIAGRMSADVESLIGLFVNTLALRATVEADMSFTDLLAQVRTMTIDAFEHQELPFEKLVLELNPKRDLSHGPLVQILFSLQNIPPLQELLAAGIDADPGQALNGHTATAKFDFALFVSEVGDRLQCSIEFNTDLFATATIAEISEHFTTLLRGIVEDPQALIARHPLLTAEHRTRSLAWSAGPERVVADLGCHQRFEMQQHATPEAVALSHRSVRGDQQLTYAALNARSNRIARHLVDRGVRPGGRVAICLPRGVDLVAAVLAIVKAGAAYVPLDPDHPVERLRLILDELDDALILAPAAIGEKLGEEVRIVDLEREAAAIAALSADGLQVAVAPDSPLYVIYTSGSTGRPKGVVMPHRAIANLIAWQAESSAAAPGAATLQYAPLHFDVASQEIFSTLTMGGRLELIDDEARRDSARLLDALADRKITRLFLPPVALEELAKAARGRTLRLDALEEVIIAGDKLQVTDDVRQLFTVLSGARLINQYGPTESHVVSQHVLQGPPETWPALPPIGRPIDNVRLLILDANGQPVPPHVNGELHIGGPALALGYLNLPEESRRRFVVDPLIPGERLYRTGDICRWDRDGVISFIGRADGQIKLRGFRIEPAEIELALKACPKIGEAVVVKRPTARGEDELVAYLVESEPGGFDRAALRARLGSRLPVYMIPGRFVRLDSLPLTPSGKLDRLRLPDPADIPGDRSDLAALVAPRTPIEQFLADCWRGLLQTPSVSVHDNFFDLGGHSLTATQLVSRIRDAWGVELPLIQVFERPTIEQLALEIVQRRAVQVEPSDLELMLAELESLSDEEIEEGLTAEVLG
jgi:amino acid adenylation domain-containing protein